MKNTVFSLLIAGAFALSSVALAGSAKTYQVTGPILEVNDNMIVVEKEKGKNERWEIARDASTKTSGEMKVGDKVTITYTMTATEIESKGASKTAKGSKASASPATSPAKK